MAENDEYSDVIFDPNVDIEDLNSESSFEEDEQQNLHPFITASSSSRESGLVNEFDILEPIGKGGFGDVMKARNKLDKRLYAIKKIPLNLESKKLNKKILREVKVLSRLNHTYVVRYYNAWTEKSNDSKIYDDREESEESLNETVDVEVMSGEFMSRINSPEQEVHTVDEASSSTKEFVKKNEETERIHLYIQMEYCEKLTLRDCIDNNLYLDTDRRWTLFREIIEGLAHIHEQGIIHRDLKPVNIFMDSNDHVKIGDFGLATSDSLRKKNIAEEGIFVGSDGEPRYDSLGDGYLSGQIGTELYASPEIMTERTKYEYNQKVDIYSLGVIFFEMCCKPFETVMEKMKVIGDLRSDIKLPDDFNQPEKESEAFILRWLLSHDPNQRPNATELLDSDQIPRQHELTRVISSITSDPQSRSYRQMIDELFSQTVSLAGAHAYDRNIYKTGFSVKTSLLQSLVSDRLIRVFRRHGAVQMNTPLLMPQQQLYENFRSYPLLMDHSGKLVGLPYDLRVPFARYISNANIKNVKRYCIEKVYRRQKVGGFHPQERTDCAFDIVTSDSKSLHPDAEVLIVMQDIINEFPPLKRSGYEITLKHTSIQKALLLHFGIPEEKHILVVVALAREQIERQSKSDTLANLNLEEGSMSALLNFLRQRGSFTEVWSKLKEIFETAGKAGTLAMEGLREIRSVITNAKILGVTLPIFVQIGCIYRTDMFNGVTFEVTCSRHLKKSRSRKNVYTNLANGGRYDNLIQQFEQRQIIPEVPMARISGVGINLAFEKIVNAMKKHSEHLAAYDILLCTVGENPMQYMEKKKMKLVKQLWNAGFKAELLHEASESEETLQEFCKANGISYLVVLLTEKLPTLKVYTIEKGKVPKEEEMDDSQLLTFLQQRLIQLPVCEQYSKTNSLTSIIRQNKISISDSDNVQQSTSVESTVSWNIVFRLQSGSLRSKVKRKNEASIKKVVQKSFPWLKVDCIEVVALDLSFSETKVLTACLEVDYSRDEFEASVKEVVKKLPAYKKCIQKVANHIGTLISGERFSCLVLYSINEARARLLTRSAI